jgi:hypothetical protein
LRVAWEHSWYVRTAWLRERCKPIVGATQGREQELAVRAALGASRRRIAAVLLVESMALGLIGGVAGVGLAWAGLRLLVRIGPANLPRLNELGIDLPTLAHDACCPDRSCRRRELSACPACLADRPQRGLEVRVGHRPT